MPLKQRNQTNQPIILSHFLHLSTLTVSFFSLAFSMFYPLSLSLHFISLSLSLSLSLFLLYFFFSSPSQFCLAKNVANHFLIKISIGENNTFNDWIQECDMYSSRSAFRSGVSMIHTTSRFLAINLFHVSLTSDSETSADISHTYEVHTISFQTFYVWALLLIVHTWNSSPIRSNLLQLQCTCTVPTNSGTAQGSPLVWACQWPSSQPLLSTQLSHNDSWARGITKSPREPGLDIREGEELSWCPSCSNSLW